MKRLCDGDVKNPCIKLRNLQKGSSVQKNGKINLIVSKLAANAPML